MIKLDVCVTLENYSYTELQALFISQYFQIQKCVVGTWNLIYDYYNQETLNHSTSEWQNEKP